MRGQLKRSPRCDEVPAGGHCCDSPAPGDGGAVHVPVRDRSRGAVVPQDVGLAVSVQIRGAHDVPVGGHRGDPAACLDRDPVHQPVGNQTC
jgi:hypothetical protein